MVEEPFICVSCSFMVCQLNVVVRVVPAARSGGALKIARRPDCRLREIRAVILECGALVLAYISSGRRAMSRRFCDRPCGSLTARAIAPNLTTPSLQPAQSFKFQTGVAYEDQTFLHSARADSSRVALRLATNRLIAKRAFGARPGPCQRD